MGDGGSTGQLTRSSSGSSIVALEEPPEGMIFPASKRQKLNKGKGRATSEDVLTFDEDDERGMLDDLVGVGSEAMKMEEGGGVVGEPEENLLASFRESRERLQKTCTEKCIAKSSISLSSYQNARSALHLQYKRSSRHVATLVSAIIEQHTPLHPERRTNTIPTIFHSSLLACGACLFSTLKTQAIRERRPPNVTGMFPTIGPGVKKPRGKADTEAWFERYGADKTGKIRGKILTGSCPVSLEGFVGWFRD